MADTTVRLDDEEWRPIPGAPGYEVSNLGRARSWKGPKSRVLKLTPSGKGYLGFTPSINGVVQHRRIHLTVLLAFVGPRPEGMEGCHWDGDKRNNRLENLRYDTPSENARDMIRHGRHIGAISAAKTHCLRGHARTPENTYVDALGSRHCRPCRRKGKAAA